MRALTLGAMSLAFGAAMIASAPAQAQDSLESKLEAKLKKEFVSAVTWHTDYDKALAASKESGKPIFAYFTRSYSP